MPPGPTGRPVCAFGGSTLYGEGLGRTDISADDLAEAMEDGSFGGRIIPEDV